MKRGRRFGMKQRSLQTMQLKMERAKWRVGRRPTNQGAPPWPALEPPPAWPARSADFPFLSNLSRKASK
jgi:hypothetical protein